MLSHHYALASAFALLSSLCSSTRASPVIPSTDANSTSNATCRYLPGDPEWPDEKAWASLNRTVGGRLIRGVPLGQPCYSPAYDGGSCSRICNEWTSLTPFVDDPVNVMSPYWMNDTCNPFLASSNTGSCSLGNLGQYAINVASPDDVMAGIRFAKGKNVRLTIKNTGHDFLGRSTGKGSLALWTHNLKEVTFIDSYQSRFYSGPAVRVGAGVEYGEVYPIASARGYRVVGGASSSVGVAGGFTQGAGHGPLGSAYGLAADQVLEWEVVTAADDVVTASPVRNSDLYWALTGGGPGNYAVVLSATVKVYPDGPVAGAGFSFTNTGDTTAYWSAVRAWFQHMLVLDTVAGLSTVFTLTAKSFSLVFSTLPDSPTTSAIDAALAPFLRQLAKLNVSVGTSYESNVHADFASHYDYWTPRMQYVSNITLGSSLIPHASVRDPNTLTALVATFRDITAGGALVLSVGLNVSNKTHPDNSVLPAWRDALFTTTFARPLSTDASVDAIKRNQAQLNAWQDQLRDAKGGVGGAYMNEATWDNAHWKSDYFGSNYHALLDIKKKYDRRRVFWANAAVGSEDWAYAGDGRLCPV
ncbi:FAD/FMN-containing isoamyl alcohol oxidase-like protein MreA [Xylariaceae sp. FL0594]|nr:FAD/FMN-containing isoamyl alcohol oxidase-like protein MreA [Xylariaceae sp. FL0594]